MIRLNIIVEGPTEENFIEKVLAPHLGAMQIFTSACCIRTRRDRRKGVIYSGGCIDYAHLKNDLQRWFKQDNHKNVFFSSMVDLYRIPKDFPYFDKAKKIVGPIEKVGCLEQGLQSDLMHPRFIPYIQLHEFEALLFCDISKLLMRYPDRQNEVNELLKIRSQFDSPEAIDDGEHTAPSKRIIKHFPEYEDEKAFVGPFIAGEIGLDLLRKCEHFDQWLRRIESLTG